MRTLLGLLILLASAEALAGPPDTVPLASQYSRAGKQRWARRTILDATVTQCVKVSPAGTAACACFGWGTMVYVVAGAEATCAWSLTSTAVLGDGTTTAATTLTVTVEEGGAADGQSAGVTLPPGSSWTMVPDFDAWFPPDCPPDAATCASTSRVAPGRRAGICNAIQTTIIDRAVYPFCRVNGDCTDSVSGTTCSDIDTPEEIRRSRYLGCAQLMCRGIAAATDITSTLER